MNFKTLKNTFLHNAKNIVGWRTKRKLIVFSVDDYGNIRVDSREARERMNREGSKVHNRFDAYDSLETRQDLEALYEVLSSVKDQFGHHAIFTPFAVPCNINFEKMEGTGFETYYYELLPQTFQKLSEQQPESYSGAWDLLNEGIENGLMVPQFHGKEHLNLKVLEEKLAVRDREVLTALKNRSYTGISSESYKTISLLAAFDFWEFEENQRFHNIIEDGLNEFEKVFGYRALHFNPPAGREHAVLHKTLKENGIHYIDTPMIKKEHQGRGRYKVKVNYTGKKNKHGQIFMVRNVVFEPTQKRNVEWVDFAMKQIEAAFRWNRPAIISSHRVNFCGHIDPENRANGLGALRELLQRIVRRWPEVEFMAANDLGDLIRDDMELI
ncbi:hypothetical protein G3570_08520 [Balneolaceae bacterium YR4-1]|uniref:Polysaccharide deacetylase n=1 Tax=Halalkalibaculum roseum TaxID=2709311 RepID=A0A6M1SZP5_9BACT|nr:hypothetical protein [Halalkalibaculum roseum]NGP76674.1 hypothetical protein [Halalkalibaculum roseum]